MKITVYPADHFGCGHFRLIMPTEALIEQGHEIDLRPPDRRDIKLKISGRRDDPAAFVEDVLDVTADVMVFQRITHRFMAQAIPILRAKGVAVVVDIDDDLSCIHPTNPAYAGYHPKNEWEISPRTGEFNRCTWQHLASACRDATLVTASTPALLERYAAHGRGQLIYNYLPSGYFGVDHQDSDRIGWPAYLLSHPDDPGELGGSLARLCADPGAFQVLGDPTGCGVAFGLARDPSGHDPVDIHGWPAAVAGLGIGIAPLADTKFNRAKSWLKPLELSALGVPWVGSPRVEYERLHRRGAGVLADTPRRWYRELKRLQDNPSLRAERAEAGRDVAGGLRLEPNAWRWFEAWARADDVQHGREVSRRILA